MSICTSGEVSRLCTCLFLLAEAELRSRERPAARFLLPPGGGCIFPASILICKMFKLGLGLSREGLLCLEWSYQLCSAELVGGWASLQQWRTPVLLLKRAEPQGYQQQPALRRTQRLCTVAHL